MLRSSSTNNLRKPPKRLRAWLPHPPWIRYGKALLLVLAASVVSDLITPAISPTNLEVIFLLAVVFSAVYLGRGPAIFASLLSVLIFDYFFVPPYFTLAVSDTEYLLTFLGMLTVSLVISQLVAMTQEQAEAARRREFQAVALYELGRDLTVTSGLENVAQTVITHIEKTFNRAAVIFLPDKEGLKVFAHSPSLTVSEQQLKSAAGAFEQGQVPAHGAGLLPDPALHCQPLKTRAGIVGVLGIDAVTQEGAMSRDQVRLLDTFANQAALAVERARLDEQAHQAELLAITDKLQAALLNSISHDLRTPLASITGALSSLQEADVTLDGASRRSLIETASEEADRLNRLVANLLDMTRLEAGGMQIRREDCDVQDVIGVSLEELKVQLADRQVKTHLPGDLPLVPMDFVLIEHVLLNLIDNALKYSPPQTPIEIHALQADSFVKIMVMDRGMGIPAEDLEHIFEKFYRVQRKGNVPGTGLGLAICRGIVEAHGGSITAANRDGGGTIITITLPEEVPA